MKKGKKLVPMQKKVLLLAISTMLTIVIDHLTRATAQEANFTAEEDPQLKIFFIVAMILALGIGMILLALVSEFRSSINLRNVFFIILSSVVFIGIIAFIPPVQDAILPKNDHFDEEIKLHVTPYTWKFYYSHVPLGNATGDVMALDSNASIPHEGFNYLTTNTLYLEAGVTYLLNATSEENLVHSFFIKELSIRLDIIPGEYRTYILAFEKPGVYDFRCLTYCGVGHDALTGVIKVFESRTR